MTKLILKDMVTAWNFEHVVVFTDCCADLHAAMESRYGWPVEPQQVFQEFENMLANCMSCRVCVFLVQHRLLNSYLSISTGKLSRENLVNLAN